MKEGDQIRCLVRGNTGNHLLNCQDGFTIDLSDWVVIKKVKGKLMAGWISLETYLNRIHEFKPHTK